MIAATYNGARSILPYLLLSIRCGLTEWEREREKEEFTRAAMLYQPLKGDMAARFTRGRNIDDDIPDKVCSQYLFQRLIY